MASSRHFSASAPTPPTRGVWGKGSQDPPCACGIPWLCKAWHTCVGVGIWQVCQQGPGNQAEKPGAVGGATPSLPPTHHREAQLRSMVGVEGKLWVHTFAQYL